MYETEYTQDNRLTSFMYAVYGLMGTALAVTCATAYVVSQIPNIRETIFSSPLIMTGIVLAQLALVIGLTASIHRLSFSAASALFGVYAVTVGVTTSVLVVVYTTGSIVQTFGVAAGMFVLMGLYGYVTGSDLSKLGSIASMALWGIILAMLVNMWLRNPMIDLIYSIIGVIVFAALTAYDTQKIKQMGQQMLGSGQMLGQVAVIGALMLYLDFINLFLFLLRFMGRRRN